MNTKEDTDSLKLIDSLEGTWMVLENVDSTQKKDSHFDGVQYINITHHNLVIEGYTVGVFYFKDKKQEKKMHTNKQRIFTGLVNKSKIIFFYQNILTKYECTYVLKPDKYSLDGKWFDSSGATGICKWIKAQKLAE